MRRAWYCFSVIPVVLALAGCGSSDTADSNETIFDIDKIVTVTAESPAPLTKTGQTRSYDEKGNEVTDGSLKDDGYYQTGTDPRFTRNDVSGIVTDHLTQLMWQDDGDPANKQWLDLIVFSLCYKGKTDACYTTSIGDTAASYCSGVTSEGYTDWRLPTAREFETIVEYWNSSDTSVFKHTADGCYWTSTTLASDPTLAWVVHGGYRFQIDKIGNCFIRCVRYGLPPQ